MRWLIWMSLALHGQQLEIRHIANAGVSLHCGERVVLVDALLREGVRRYERVPDDLLQRLEKAKDEYRGVRLVVATHVHRDHFDVESVRAHLAANPKAVFAGPKQAVDAVGKGSSEDVEFDGGKVSLRVVPHDGNAGQTIENAVVRLEFCGKTVAVSGDAAPEAKWFEGLGPVEWAVVPWWYLNGDIGRRTVSGVLRAKGAWAVHWDAEGFRDHLDAVRRSMPVVRIGKQAVKK
jgi:L-ascorbate metabolism protein UlaG (beta-lactamase superfamily)